MVELTYEDKILMFEDGKYVMPAPPVLTTLWTTESWIKFIDKEGRWTPDAP